MHGFSIVTEHRFHGLSFPRGQSNVAFRILEGGGTPYSPPAVLSPGGLANTGLWGLKSVTYYTPCFCLFTQGKRLRDVPCCLIYLEFNLFEVKFSEAHSYLGFAMVK